MRPIRVTQRIGGVLFNKTLTTLVQFPAGLGSGYAISNGITDIGNEAFDGCVSLASVTLPDSVTNIGNGAFENCTGLTNVLMGNSVTNIGNDAFNGCASLTNVTLPGNLASIGDGAFGSCSNLTSITIPASVTNVGAGAFASIAAALTQANFLGDAPGVDGADGSADNSVLPAQPARRIILREPPAGTPPSAAGPQQR
jgi:hypothetical protein